MKSRIVEWALVTLAGIALAGVAPWAALHVTPIGMFIRYDRVEIIEPARAGGPLNMVSVMGRWGVGGIIYFNDILRCDTNNDGQFENYSHQMAGPIPSKPHEVKVFPWTYRGAVPGKGVTCFMESNITYELHWGPYQVERHVPQYISRTVTIQ